MQEETSGHSLSPGALPPGPLGPAFLVSSQSNSGGNPVTVRRMWLWDPWALVGREPLQSLVKRIGVSASPARGQDKTTGLPLPPQLQDGSPTSAPSPRHKKLSNWGAL